MTTHTVDQPFMRINTPHPCRVTDRHATQIVPVAGNRDRATHVFVVQHGLDYLTLEGTVTTTPVWLTWAEAEAAEQAHADQVARELLEAQRDRDELARERNAEWWDE